MCSRLADGQLDATTDSANESTTEDRRPLIAMDNGDDDDVEVMTVHETNTPVVHTVTFAESGECAHYIL